MRLIKSLLSLSIMATTLPSFAQSAPIVQIDSGKLQGIETQIIQQFLGIPYAKAPVGELRWKAPQAVEKWDGIRNATAFGNQCPQNRDLGDFASAGGQEDCLTLNVTAPKNAKAGDKLPVMVWIHGGALWVGSGSDYDSAKLAEEGNAVVVTFNYRLASLGTFAHPALRSDGVNFAMLDQQAVLDWVQRNISQFGGDPKNVTIFGESSGGNSVLAQVISPKSKDKFQRAIAMSGSAVILKGDTFGSARELDYAEKQAVAFAKELGCEGDDQTVASCLRKVPLDQILAKQRPYLMQQPVVDGDFLPMHPSDAIKTGNFNKVELINGHVRDEGTFFVGFPETDSGKVLSEAHYLDALKGMYGKNAEKVAEKYPLANYPSPSEAFAESITAYLFACPERTVNRYANDYTNVYAYEFADQTAPGYLKPTSFPLGASHTYELPYLFKGFKGSKQNPIDRPLNPLQNELAAKMVKSWTDQNQWKADDKFRDQDNNAVMFNITQIKDKNNVYQRYQCEFWDSLGVY